MHGARHAPGHGGVHGPDSGGGQAGQGGAHAVGHRGITLNFWEREQKQFSGAARLAERGGAGRRDGSSGRRAGGSGGIFIFWDRPFVVGDLVEIGAGIRSRTPAKLPDRPCVFVADEHTEPWRDPLVRDGDVRVTLRAGEAHKTIEAAARIWDAVTGRLRDAGVLSDKATGDVCTRVVVGGGRCAEATGV